MSVALEVSQDEISPLNDEAAVPAKHGQDELAQIMALMLVTLEVSHVEMCPYLVSAVDESESHSSTAPDSVEPVKKEGVGRGVGSGLG